MTFSLPSIDGIALGEAGAWAYLLLFAIALLESTAFIGLTFPGTVLMMLMGGLCATGVMDVRLAIAVASIAGISGDTMSYEFGRRGKEFLLTRPRLKAQIAHGNAFMRRHKRWGVILARFRTSMRALVPIVCGMNGMNRSVFHVSNVAGAILISTLWLMGGYIGMLGLITAFFWVSRAEGFWLGLIVLAVPLTILWLWAIRKGRRGYMVLKTLAQAGIQHVIRRPTVQAWAIKHPQLSRFLRARLSLKSYFGIPFLVTLIAIAYAGRMLAVIIHQYIISGPIVDLDEQVLSLLFTFRTETVLRAFFSISLLSSVQIILILAVLVTVAFLLKRRSLYLLSLWLSLGSASVIAWNLKILFARHRPPEFYAAVHEATFAFPSAHATYAVALYGCLTYLVMRSRRISWHTKMSVLFACLSIIVAIDFSRLYLGVHYVSDVLAGNLIGFIGLLISIILTEWLLGMRPYGDDVQPVPPALMSTLFFSGIAVVMIMVLLTPPPVRLVAIPIREENIPDDAITNLFDRGTLTPFTETLIGNPQEPLNLIVLAENDQCLLDHFSRAGWNLADDLSPASLYRGLRAAILNEPYPSAPVTPYFYQGEPHTLGLQQETDLRTARNRHHARFWRTKYVTPSGRLYVGTASFDNGIKWGGFTLFLTHSIAADIDSERAHILESLKQVNAVQQHELFPLVPPLIGRNLTGDTFYTDGKAEVVELEECTKR